MSNKENENGKEKRIEAEVEAEERKRREKDQIGDEKGVFGAEIIEEMEKAYIDYAMSVIVSRALPSAEDGLKPVHRRILYAMNKLGLTPEKQTRKSATIVGEVIGKYHPHGDKAVYDALVRLAQVFSLRYPLVHGQGNMGSLDGDPPAAQRYTEAKLSKISGQMLEDIEKETVKMLPNFDNTEKEPEILPAKLPNLLLNGTTGIAVGMATNIPPHNLGELCDAAVEFIDNPKAEVIDLMKYVKGPDFPTGGYALGPGISDMYKTGKGKVIMRAKTSEEDIKGKSFIVVTEIPYMVNKADLIKDIARLAGEKKLPDVSDLRDESSKGKVRIVIEMKKGSDPKFTLNKLYKLTKMQTNFDANILALVGKDPRILDLKAVISEYVKHRKDVVEKRTKFDLKKAEERLEIVLGLLIALRNIDEIVSLIKKSRAAKEAHDGLMKKFNLTARQAQAVLEMRLQSLTSLESSRLKEEEKKLNELIAKFKKILSSDKEILRVVKLEVLELKKNFGDDRRTRIIKKVDEISEEDLVEKKDVVVTITKSAYIKRLDLKTYKEQKRGGSGVIGSGLKEEDIVVDLISCSTHDQLLFFTTRGRVFWIKTHEIPSGERQSKGRSLANLLNLRDEDLASVMPFSGEEGFLMFATQNGQVKKLAVKDLGKARSTGVRIMNLPADGSDIIIDVKRIEDRQEVLLISKKGQAVRFSSDDVRAMGRSSYGVRGVDLKKGDQVVSLGVVPNTKENSTVLTITEKGFGKRSKLDDYRKTSRGGKGVINLKTSSKTGDIVKSVSVDGKDSVIATTIKGMIIRTSMKGLRVMGRATQGVRVIKLKEGDKVADIVKVPKEEIIDIKE